MSDAHLAVYLHDHRAGAAAAVELLHRLEQNHADTPIAPFAEALRNEIEADIRELEALMSRAGISPSLVRNASGWITAKMAELKVRIDDPIDGALRLLETLETLSLGIEGKRGLWIALAAASEQIPALSGVDYARLRQRAEVQRGGVETQRVLAAKAALRRG
jgi:hypothetical protein